MTWSSAWNLVSVSVAKSPSRLSPLVALDTPQAVDPQAFSSAMQMNYNVGMMTSTGFPRINTVKLCVW